MTRLTWHTTLENLVGEDASLSNWVALFWRKHTKRDAPQKIKKMHVICVNDYERHTNQFTPGDVLQNKYRRSEKVRVNSYDEKRQWYEVTYVDSGTRGHYAARILEDAYMKASSNHVPLRQRDFDDLRNTFWKSQITGDVVLIETSPDSNGNFIANTNAGHVSMNIVDLIDDWREVTF